MQRNLIISLNLFLTFSNIAYTQFVTTSTGPVQGFVKTTKNGKTAHVFYGIPYAEPPVDNLRFQAPRPTGAWKEVLNATYERPYCYQFSSEDEPKTISESEDCLHINIFAPSKQNRPSDFEEETFPVLIWIHGGSFASGGANLYNVDGTIDNFVSRGIVFIAVNYRLGPFGFISSVRYGIPGNFGHFDLVVAFDWIYNNIVHFGGDIDYISIGGHSSGSVSAVLVSLERSNKIRTIITSSGSPFAPWALRTKNTNSNSDYLIRSMCRGEKNKFQCLMSKNISEYKHAWRKMSSAADADYYSQKSVFYFNPFLYAKPYFTPVYPGCKNSTGTSSLPRNFEDMTKRAVTLPPVMVGVNSLEYIGMHTKLQEFASRLKKNHSSIRTVASSNLLASAKTVKAAIRQIYTNIDNQLRKTLIEIASDALIVCPALYLAAFNTRAYVYMFNATTTENLRNFKAIGGVGHGSDLLYIFGSNRVNQIADSPNLKWSVQDLRIQDFVLDSIHQFMLIGNPHFSEQHQGTSTRWTKFSFKNPAFMSINHNRFEMMHYSTRKVVFWMKTFPNITAMVYRNYSI